jgi:inhibitor of KinA sporulation pathway (predicted exonuclease)
MASIDSSRVLYLDLELNTGEVKADHKIVQIGIVEVDTINLTMTRKVEYYVKPYGDFKIHFWCTKLTGIHDSTIRKQGRLWHEVHGTLNQLGIKNKMTFVWGDDGKCLNRVYNEANLINPFNITNLAWMFKNICKTKQNIGVSKALELLGLQFEGEPHRALNDAVNTARIHIELLKIFREHKSYGPIQEQLDAFRENERVRLEEERKRNHQRNQSRCESSAKVNPSIE